MRRGRARLYGRRAMAAPRADMGWARLFETSFKRSQNPMALTDDSRKILEVNGAMAQLMGRRPSDLVGRYTYNFVAEGPLLSREQWHRAIANGEVTGDAEVKLANDDTVHVQFGVHPQVVR